MKVAINYANAPFRGTQKNNTQSAYAVGGIDKVIEYGPNDIDKEFKEKYKDILNSKRGGGYWLWKPYIIKKTIDIIDYGDYLFYVDSGSYFISSVDSVIDVMKNDGIDIMSFSIPFRELQWTKKEIFEYFKCEDKTVIKESCQRIATFIFLKKTDKSINFVNEYLRVATFGTLITDELRDDFPEDNRFIENRHDQSIFSVLAKVHNIPVYRDPSEFGIKPKLLFGMDKRSEFVLPTVQKSLYPQILVLHRKRKIDKYVKFTAMLRRIFPWWAYRLVLMLQKGINNFTQK